MRLMENFPEDLVNIAHKLSLDPEQDEAQPALGEILLT
jgi:hypothetical protein